MRRSKLMTVVVVGTAFLVPAGARADGHAAHGTAASVAVVEPTTTPRDGNTVAGPNAARRVVAGVLLAALGAGLWWLSNPRRVFLLASAGESRAAADSHNVFGIGRFARPRNGPAQRL